MADFQAKFFPAIAVHEVDYTKTEISPVKAAYCKYNSQVLQLVVSSLYLSALFSGIIASKFARLYGRKVGFLSVMFQLCTCHVIMPCCDIAEVMPVASAYLCALYNTCAAVCNVY